MHHHHHMRSDVRTAAPANALPPADWSHKIESIRFELNQMQAAFERTDKARPNLDKARAMIRARGARQRFFDADLFADPAWDILLELYVCELSQQRISVSSLCDAAQVPATTALRWIRMLEGQGLLTRTADPMDGRRYWMSLTPAAVDKMEAFFEAM